MFRVSFYKNFKWIEFIYIGRDEAEGFGVGHDKMFGAAQDECVRGYWEGDDEPTFLIKPIN